METSL